MANELQITVSRQQGRVPVTIFHLKGNIDANSHELLEAEARKAFEVGDRNLLLDLSQVGYMSSAGLRAIHAIFILLRTDTQKESDEAIKQGLRDGTFKSSHLKLLNPTPTVQEALNIMGIDMILEIHTNLSKAIASF
jgi:anti-anti-sigma factor